MIISDKPLLTLVLIINFLNVVFAVSVLQSDPYIQITYPLANSTHYVCDTLPIAWEVTVPGGVVSQIRFIRQENVDSHNISVIASNVLSPGTTGVYNWTISDVYNSGISYLVLIYEAHTAAVEFTVLNNGETCNISKPTTISDITHTNRMPSHTITAASTVVSPVKYSTSNSRPSSAVIAGVTIVGFAAFVCIVTLFTIYRTSRRKKNMDAESNVNSSAILMVQEQNSRRSSALALLDPERRTSFFTDQSSASSSDLYSRRDSPFYDQSRSGSGSAIDQRSMLGTINEGTGAELPPLFEDSPLATDRPLLSTPNSRRSSRLNAANELYTESPHADISDLRAPDPPFFHMDNHMVKTINPHPLPPLPISPPAHPYKLWRTDENAITEDAADKDAIIDDINADNTNVVYPFENDDSHVEDGRVDDMNTEDTNVNDMNTEDADVKNEEGNDMNTDSTNILDSHESGSQAEDVHTHEEGNDINADSMNILDSHESGSQAEDVHTHEEGNDMNNDSTNILDSHENGSHAGDAGDTHAENMNTDNMNSNISHTIDPTVDANSTVAHAGNEENVLTDEQEQ